MVYRVNLMETITFYSYKGGVGRTLALANIAIYLSRFGQDVCVLDFDLEAPGLHYKLLPLFPGPVQWGLVDYIYEFISGDNIPGSIEKYFRKAEKLPAGYGSIRLIPAGNVLCAQYWKRLAAINWHDLFYKEESEGVPFFLDFKEKIRKEINPDFLLVDSRTGITEMSGICTSVLTDRVVFFISNNRENIEGARQILRGIQKSPRLPDQKPVEVNFVLTRIPFPADTEARRSKEEIIGSIQKFLNEDTGNLADQLNVSEISVLHSDRELELAEGLRLTGDNFIDIPLARDYLKLFSKIIPEDLVKPKIQELIKNLVTPRRALEEPERIKSELEAIAFAYPQSSLIKELTDFYYYRMRERQDYGDDASLLEQYQKSLEIYEKLGDSQGAAESLLKIGTIYQDKGDYHSALKNYQKSLEIREKIGDTRGIAESLHQIGMIYEQRGDYDAALDYYQKALEIKEKIGDKKGKAISLHQLGKIHEERGDYDAALDHYQKALEISEKIGDMLGMALILGQMGSVYIEKKDYQEALRLCLKSLTNFQKIGSPKENIVQSLIERIMQKIPGKDFTKLLEKISKELGIEDQQD